MDLCFSGNHTAAVRAASSAEGCAVLRFYDAILEGSVDSPDLNSCAVPPPPPPFEVGGGGGWGAGVGWQIRKKG
jgi:hypothetical protein